ncbi:hypothetical protein N7528_007435 [Penicillium herquei]|nr:hypothetical protein N7528_007435 [Penicillium herquei]
MQKFDLLLHNDRIIWPYYFELNNAWTFASNSDLGVKFLIDDYSAETAMFEGEQSRPQRHDCVGSALKFERTMMFGDIVSLHEDIHIFSATERCNRATRSRSVAANIENESTTWESRSEC